MEAFRQAFWELILPQIPVVMDSYEPCLQAIADGDLNVKALSGETDEEMFAATAGIREGDTAMLGCSNTQEPQISWDGGKVEQLVSHSKYQDGLFEVAAGRKGEYMTSLADFQADSYPEITN